MCYQKDPHFLARSLPKTPLNLSPKDPLFLIYPPKTPLFHSMILISTMFGRFWRPNVDFLKTERPLFYDLSPIDPHFCGNLSPKDPHFSVTLVTQWHHGPRCLMALVRHFYIRTPPLIPLKVKPVKPWKVKLLPFSMWILTLSNKPFMLNGSWTSSSNGCCIFVITFTL